MLVLTTSAEQIDMLTVNPINILPLFSYIYGFETKEWSLDTPTPKLNSRNQSANMFSVRYGHNAVVANNYMIYITGENSVWG
jgi:hypothetical protein